MYTETPARSHRLFFVQKTETPEKRPPELGIAIAKRDAPHLTEWLHHHASGLGRAAKDYLLRGTTFSWPVASQPELTSEDGVSRIGYRKCGYLLQEEGEWQLRFPLVRKHASEIALSLSILLEAISGLPETARTSNRSQMLDITTQCNRSGHCAHAMHGDVYPGARAWLRKRSEQQLPSEITEAMREVWEATAPRNIRRYSDECSARVGEDGRFILCCFGNACDVAIYPDLVWDNDPSHGCEFSCHNLDLVSQQLTLLAGLAVMMKLIEADA